VTYVFVPATIAWHAGLLPPGAVLPVTAAMLVSSALGFSRSDAKTADYFFTGFPSYWNIVVFYLAAGAWPPAVNAGILLACAALVFVPIGYVYPSRTPVLRVWTNTLGIVWALGMVLLALQMPAVPQGWLLASLAYPLYYTGLSLVLHARRRVR
jgi:phosphatidylcholine synthase